MRYFIVAVQTDSDSPYYMETGWIYKHDPSNMQETETTIQLHNELLFGNDDHESAPKELLLEITEDDYKLLDRILELGYDNGDMQNQIIRCRREDGSNEKPFAVAT